MLVREMGFQFEVRVLNVLLLFACFTLTVLSFRWSIMQAIPLGFVVPFLLLLCFAKLVVRVVSNVRTACVWFICDVLHAFVVAAYVA